VKIGFIGIGKLGLPCAEVIAEKGHDVTGYDVVNVKSDKVTVCSSIKEAVKDRNIVFIAVPTPHHPDYDGKAPTAHLEPKDFGYDIVIDCIREANMHMNKDQLLVLISTVLPGTVRREFAPLVTNTRFVYNPYLIAMGTVAWDMVNPEMIMMGGDESAMEILENFYKSICDCDRYIRGTYEECESIKIFYNTFITTKITLANMVQDVAMKLGNMNVDVVTNALAQSTLRIMSPKYMKAGMGDGGSCHPRDNIALRWLAQELDLGYDMFDTIIVAREKQALNMAKYLKKLSAEHDLPIVIHCRDAFDEIFEILDKENCDKLRGVFHCFTGTLEQAKRAIDLGFVLGIGGVVTFKNGGIDKFLNQIDLKHIVLETDAPYLAPVPFRGKRNESSYIIYVIEKLAEIYGLSKEEIADVTTKNAEKVFAL